MFMKKSITGLVIIIFIAGGYFIFLDKEGDSVIETFEGVVTAVDLDAAAYDGPILISMEDGSGKTGTIVVPSMGLPLCPAFESIASVYDVAVGDAVSARGTLNGEGQIVPCEDATHYLTVMSTVTNTELGYRFTYTKGPNGYILVEGDMSEHTDFVSGVTLFDRAEYGLFLASDEAREGPAAIGFRVYTNPGKLSAFVWPEKNRQESNIGLALGEPEEVVIGGANASRYLVDGLYPIDTYVVAYGKYIYILSGAYLDEGSDIHQAFQEIIKTFEFIQTENEI